ncbi:MAG: TraR/DksA family transcriptional regulator [Calditrichaeota bacterium]|nr:MAG: TraR/DksA family transcriptional regulator [Calditrichota bacterium]
MKKEDLEYFKKLLIQKRDEMLKELGNLRDNDLNTTLKDASGENSAYAYHMADIGTDNMEREKAFFFATREERFLYHIEQALERIENGTYGLCQECGEPIGRERLEAVPHARLCIRCKSKEEQGLIGR